MGEKQRQTLLVLIAVFIFVFSRIILGLLPWEGPFGVHTSVWLALIVAPFLGFMVIYLIAQSRLEKKISAGRLFLFLAAIALLIIVLMGQATLVAWLSALQDRSTLLSKVNLGLMAGWHGWLFPTVVLVTFFSILILKWRRTG